jgi:hypothetical protein
MHDSPNFPIHPELILWSVPGEGFLMRVLVREMVAYDPSLFDLNHQALLAHAPDLDDVHYVTDSDDVFALSFAPLARTSSGTSGRSDSTRPRSEAGGLDMTVRPTTLSPVSISTYTLLPVRRRSGGGQKSNPTP